MNKAPKPITNLIVVIVGGLVAYNTYPWFFTNSYLVFVPALAAFYAAVSGLQFIFELPVVIYRLIQRMIIMKPSDRAGSAGWASFKDLKKARMFKRRKNKFFLGTYEGRAVWVDFESSMLVLSPAGGGKTVSIVIPALCHNTDSMIVPDFKSTLRPMTGELRKKKLKHTVIQINPKGLYEDQIGPSATYNLLQVIINDWEDEKYHDQVMVKAKALAIQLYPEPERQGENQYFRNGTRKFLVFAFLEVIINSDNSTLTEAFSLLSDSTALKDAIEQASFSNALNGDFSLLAKDLLSKYKDGDPKQIESFREGAVQALEVFSPSSAIAKVSAKSSFSFADLRKKKTTIYLMCDPTATTVYAPWLAALMWSAINELIRSPKGNSVVLLCDEITNFKIHNLPKLMTMLREFKVKVLLIVQELQEWGATYGMNSIQTLLSQCEVKLFLSVSDHKTSQLISDMMGDMTIKTKSFSLGKDRFEKPTCSVQDSGRKLKTADEIRRMDKIIAIIRKLRPIEIEKVGYHQVSPWRRWVKPNPLFGAKYKGRRRLKV